MKMFSRLLCTAAAICTGAGLLASPASASELKYKFEKGQTLKYRVTNETVANMDMGGQQMKQNVILGTDLSMMVKEVAEDGSATFEAKYTAAKLDMDSPMGKMNFDSSKKEGNSPMLETMGGMIDKPFTLVLTSSGQVKEIKGLAEAMGAAAGMGEMFGEEQMKATFEQAFYVLPDGPAEAGKSWMRESKQGPMKFENTYTLKSIDGGIATIEGVGKITLTEKEQMGMTIELKESEAKSTITFDAGKGQLTKSVGTGNFTMAMSGQGMTMSTKASTKTTTERID